MGAGSNQGEKNIQNRVASLTAAGAFCTLHTQTPHSPGTRSSLTLICGWVPPKSQGPTVGGCRVRWVAHCNVQRVPSRPAPTQQEEQKNHAQQARCGNEKARHALFYCIPDVGPGLPLRKRERKRHTQRDIQQTVQEGITLRGHKGSRWCTQASLQKIHTLPQHNQNRTQTHTRTPGATHTHPYQSLHRSNRTQLVPSKGWRGEAMVVVVVVVGSALPTQLPGRTIQALAMYRGTKQETSTCTVAHIETVTTRNQHLHSRAQ